MRQGKYLLLTGLITLKLVDRIYRDHIRGESDDVFGNVLLNVLECSVILLFPSCAESAHNAVTPVDRSEVQPEPYSQVHGYACNR